ncbi:PAS domain S-box protein [Hyalangium rubrum]|uniref:histidine kinase n=1 Tax=Hyalangium rubrum TaxID=3103134 RepID=A0ABU5HAE3_9BACT|nr:PAS domain S-box protein [Hyalangium sp. s54d21]MDY7230280.1 PAS domain S-box protein [Hyalangium sp. s54d21]
MPKAAHGTPDEVRARQHGALGEELFQVRNRGLIRAILNNISEGISISDAQGTYIYSTPFCEWLFGVPESTPQEDWDKQGFFFPDEQTPFPVAQLPLWGALKGEEVRDVDMFVRNANVPQGRHVRINCLPLRDEKEQLIGTMSLVKDVTKARQTEEEKRRTEQRFQLLVEIAREGIWTIDATNRTNYVNRYMADLLGYSVEEMLGKPLFYFMDEEGQAIAHENLRRRRQGISETFDFKLIRKDGTALWTSISTTPIKDEHGDYVGSMATLTDITERRRAEEQVRKLNAELERRIAERTAELEFSNRELEAFAYSVAHDLRTPLRSIASFSDALTEDCASRLDDTGLDYLRRIRGGAQRMAELIDGILALSRVNRTTLASKPCDLSAMARSIAEQLQVLQPERKAHFLIQEGLVDRGDPQLLRSVLENLLSNAWKFTRERPLAEIELGVKQESSGGRTYFVKDNGAGFNMEYRDKLFGVFQRLHTQSEFEGTGVGLATVERIIRRHGGRIWGEGQPGRGACFSFTLNELPLPPGTGLTTPRKASP